MYYGDYGNYNKSLSRPYSYPTTNTERVSKPQNEPLIPLNKQGKTSNITKIESRPECVTLDAMNWPAEVLAMVNQHVKPGDNLERFDAIGYAFDNIADTHEFDYFKA